MAYSLFLTKKKVCFLVLLAVMGILALSCTEELEPMPTNAVAKPDQISKIWKVDEVLADNVKDASTDYRSVRFEFKKTGIYKVSTVNGVVEGSLEFADNEQNCFSTKAPKTRST